MATRYLRTTVANYNKEVVFACENQYFVLIIADGDTSDARLLQNLLSSHKKGDTLLILHSVYVDQTTNLTDTDITTHSPEWY